MEQILRYFMAPKLGRGTVLAKFLADREALIIIEFATPRGEQNCVKLRAVPSQVMSMPSPGIHTLYRLSRHAISQVQHCVKGESFDENYLELDCSVRPWNGDLSESPYGGATVGQVRLRAAIPMSIKKRIMSWKRTGPVSY
jgi:hypothetical protein